MQTPRRSFGNAFRLAATFVLLLLLLLAGPVALARADDETRNGNGDQERNSQSGERTSDKRQVDPPRGITVRLADHQQRGRMTAYDAAGFDLVDSDGNTHFIRWTQLPPRRVYTIHRELLPRDDARAWLALAVTLRAMEEGEAWSDRALQHLERLDDSFAEQAQRVREGKPVTFAPTDGDADEDPQGDRSEDGALEITTTAPRTVGQAEAQYWGELDAQQQRSAIRRLDAFARNGARRVDATLQRYETRYFLLYTDLTDSEAERWVGLMDRMYARLADLFGIPEGENIWHGKCLVVIFRRAEKYHQFERTVHGHAAPGTAGRCWTFGNGDVHISFYRQSNPFHFAHVLVHEAVHGFLHRYRSPQRIPSWLNEGLADAIAEELVPQDRTVERRQRLSVTALRRKASLGGFFDAPQIEAWQYGIASDLTTFMLRQSNARYVRLIKGIKAGKAWRQSLEDSFNITEQQLIAAWARSHDLDDVQW